MSSSAKAEAVLALHRFGMGPRPGSIAAIEADPRGALIAELDRPAATEIAASSLPSSAKAFRTVNEANAKRQAKAIVAKKEQDAKRQQMVDASTMTEGAAQGMGEMAAKIAAEAVPDPGRPIYLEEAKVRIEAAFGAEIGFAERLVWFWSNHFCVSADKIRSMSGAYEREAIRPHVLWSLHRSVAGGGGSSGDAVLSRPDHFDGRQFDRRHQPHPWPQRESCPRDSGIAYARRAQRLHPG
jgi:uncharacterized protein (DUF1800 family)